MCLLTDYSIYIRNKHLLVEVYKIAPAIKRRVFSVDGKVTWARVQVHRRYYSQLDSTRDLTVPICLSIGRD